MEDKANILIVDDEVGPRESLRMILKPFYNVSVAENGERALETIKQEPVNLVTLDIRMPGISGIEVLKEIKEYNSDIEVIILTGFGNYNTAVDAVRCGALDYISKPFDTFKVEELVKKGIDKNKFNILSRQLAQKLEISKEEMPAAVKNGSGQLEEQLMHAEKLTVLGQLAPKIAHEINNPLQIIYGRAQQGMIKSKHGEPLNKYFDSIFAEAERIDHITKQLMSYGRPSEHKKETIDIKDVLEDSLTLLKDFGEIKRCEIHRFYKKSLPFLIGVDKFQFEQVFINLIINASHAMEGVEEKKLVVTTDVSSEENSIEINISDTGCGMSEENMEKIFTPFFTTKEGAKGNGLGLSVVRTIVHKHQGRIKVKSKVGKGTSFKIILPVDFNGEN